MKHNKCSVPLKKHVQFVQEFRPSHFAGSLWSIKVRFLLSIDRLLFGISVLTFILRSGSGFLRILRSRNFYMTIHTRQTDTYQ